MAEQLADKKCVPCRAGVPALKGKELEALHKNVPQWSIFNQHHLSRAFTFPDFKQALDFVNRVGALAEEQGHHPDILLAWGKAEITLWTHSVLTTARHIYQKAGFTLTRSEKHQSWGRPVISEHWDLEL